MRAALRPWIAGLAALAALGAPLARAGGTVELAPADRPSWSLTNVFAPITGLFLGGPSYWYAPRRIAIETVPSGALLDLFYVRRNFQKGFEQAQSPVTVVLPSRIEAGPRDTLVVRARGPRGARDARLRDRARARLPRAAGAGRPGAGPARDRGSPRGAGEPRRHPRRARRVARAAAARPRPRRAPRAERRGPARRAALAPGRGSGARCARARDRP